MENIILLNKVKNIGARNQTSTIPVELSSSSKPLVIKDLKDSVDLYDVYLAERGKCHRYRFTVTIRPYCTNVLFNMCTEVVKDEGSDDCECVFDGSTSITPSIDGRKVYGEYESTKLKRAYMVSNTEYSSPDIGYTYYPGYDIFNNHTLRNLSFRPVMEVKSNLQQTRPVFNTVRDLMRTKDGKPISFYPRFSYEDVESRVNLRMHIYEHSNLLSFIDGSSAETNLRVENGWFGFANSSSIKDGKEKEVIQFPTDEQHEFSHTINNVGNCQFVDMFPDRTRFALVPKYNQFRHRYEKNWDVFLTYPWKNFDNHNIVKNVKSLDYNRDGDGKTNALATLRTTWTRLGTNRKSLLFRTFSKHGLSLNDTIAVYVSKNFGATYERLTRVYTVDYLGDLNGNNREYFFGISSRRLLNDIFTGDIESTFYVETQPVIVDEIEDVSGVMTDVPEEYSPIPIRCFNYVHGSEYSSYEESTTFDTMPKTININSPIHIRVWKTGLNIYKYYMWNTNGEERYVERLQNPEVEYGDTNTFTDVPAEYVTQYIRVKQYDYYDRKMTMYVMRRNIDIDEEINNKFSINNATENTWHIRFVKVKNEVDCKYYIRKFRKIPNLKFSREGIPEGITLNEEAYLNYLGENACDEAGDMLSFDSETYKLAFSKTLYGDDVAQVTFLDTVDVENITDNLGRPISEIYATVVKRNKGYKIWYGTESREQITSPDVEYSRCFGSLTTGLEYLDLDDRFDLDDEVKTLKGRMSSVSSIYRDEADVDNTTLSLEEWDEEADDTEILENDDVFYGDLVEYNPSQCIETVLSDACFRFNTAQREMGRCDNDEDFNFTYDELIYDDYDPIGDIYPREEPFLVREYRSWGVDVETNELAEAPNIIQVRRHEGYFYNPHTRIPLLKYSDKVNQGSHRTLPIKFCEPLQSNAMYMKVTTRTMHGISSGEDVFLCHNSEWTELTVLHVIDKYRFVLNVMPKDDYERNGNTYLDWVEICNGLVNGTMKLRVKNYEIPSYADMIEDNLFIWRTLVNPSDLQEGDAYYFPFANNSFYVDTQTAIYLRRQDPQNLTNLYYFGELPDIEGKVRRQPNNVYKEEYEYVC